jgi:hypothetical protein
MNMLEDVQNWRGMRMVDADLHRIGTIENIFLDGHTGEPEFAKLR